MRRATDAEAAAVRAALDGLERGLADILLEHAGLGCVEREGTRWATLVSPDVMDLAAGLLAGAEAGGLPLGTLDDEGFHIDLQGAVEAARAGAVHRQAVRVNEKASRLFVYHRDVLGGSILEYDPRLQPGDFCLVLNPRREAIGIGEVVGRFKGTGRAVRPVHDLGAYLREQDP